MEINNSLNDMQREAVEYNNGPLLILAGAGSGKTRVLTTKIAYLADEGVAPWNILAITFTNKAASEMKERVRNYIGINSNDLWMGTFHSVCVRILRREIGVMGYSSNFLIYDTSDQLSVIKDCLKELNMDEKMFPPKNLQQAISNSKNQLISPDGMALAGWGTTDKIANVYKLYQKKLKQNNGLDFDDIIMVTVDLFKRNPHILEYYQEKFKYILVDEYQDTNIAQYQLINFLAHKHRKITVVGDDDQSIYGWRGADLRNILDFEKDYPDAKVIRLEQNYRSTKTILDAANCVISNNYGRKGKTLWTGNPKGNGIGFFKGETEHHESFYIASKIKNLMDRGYKYGEFAILYRTNAQSRVIEDAMARFGIPYRIIGGLKYFDRKEIKDLLAYLRIISNPHDDLSIKRVINVPKRGIGNVTIGKLEEYQRIYGITLYNVLKEVENISGLSAKAKADLNKFITLLDVLRDIAIETPLDLLPEKILAISGYLEELILEDTIESRSRIENLKEFTSLTIEYKDKHGDNLQEFLSYISLITDIDTLEDGEGGVLLMTLHSAKGLEFPVVFVSGMEEGIFPISRALSNDNELEEERRLCYVGMTRAKDLLYLTCARVRTIFGRTSYNTESRFLREIPFKLMEDNMIKEFDPNEEGNTSYGVGDTVKHSKFGIGEILGVKGEGANTQVTIDFNMVGVKSLLLAYANLTKV